MRFLRPTAIIAAFLIIAVSIPPAPLSQKAPASPQPKRPGPPKRQAKRPQRADALASVINELLKLAPLPPQSPDEKDLDNADASSEERRKPPADDAAINELVDYWYEHEVVGKHDPKPSDKVRQRLLEACEDRPELTSVLDDILPETTDTHDRLYKLLEEGLGDDSIWKSSLRYWLQHNSRYFRNDLIASARGEADDLDPPEVSLRSLARLDWDAARPMVETFASSANAQMMTVALSLLYERALAVGDSAQVEKYREQLKAIVTNLKFPHQASQTALSSLAQTEWKGQEDWVISLFADPKLGGLKVNAGENDGGSKVESVVMTDKLREIVENVSKTISSFRDENILSSLMRKNVKRWLPVISNLVGHTHRTVHQSAVRCLATCLNPLSDDIKLKNEIAKKLAPWLTNPDWVAADGRSDFIQSLFDVQAPELLPGLIWVLEHDEDLDNRAAAAEALTQYRDQTAIPALRRALEMEEDEVRRGKIVTALAECGGLSEDEMAAAVEAYAKMVVTEAGEEEIDQAKSGDSEKPLPMQVSIGRILNGSEKIQGAEGLAVRLIERATLLRASQPAVARQMLRSIEGVPLRAAEINLVERIGEGWADFDALKLALENRDSIQKSATAELYSLIKQGGYAAGVAAAILNEEREYRETLKGTDAKAQLALLAGARYLRDKLPVELASRLLDSPNRALAKAVESYLKVEDSAEARKLVLARHRGEAYILGDGAESFEPYLENLRKWEEAMRKEIKGAAGLEAIYALARSGSVENFNGVTIRVRDGKAEISVYEVEGRRDVRMLTESEFEELKSFTSRHEVEGLGPESYDDTPPRVRYEYLRLTKVGGRRIVLNGNPGLRRTPNNPTLHEELSGLFYRLIRSGDFVTRYAIEDKIPGFEVLLADKKRDAAMVCGEGREIRVLVGEKGAEYKRGFPNAMCEWHEVSSEKLGKVTDEPAACPRLGLIPSYLKIRSNYLYHGDGNSSEIGSPTRSGSAWVYASSGIDAGVWKVEHGPEPEKIISGSYAYPVVTPDSKWLVAIKTLSEGEKHSSQLVRHNLQTGEEFQVDIANDGDRPPFMYIAARGKVLLGYQNIHGQSRLGAINHLLDPETGTLQQVKGEFGPLADRFARELQPTGNPNEFWAAIQDSQKGVTRIGRYDSRNFVFTPLVEAPRPVLSDSNFWVDEDAGKIWFTYEGHLLRIPLPAQTK
jgi:hypothetical protein